MIKKVVTVLSGIALAGVIVLASSVETKAALPSTYDIINDANANIASGKYFVVNNQLYLSPICQDDGSHSR